MTQPPNITTQTAPTRRTGLWIVWALIIAVLIMVGVQLTRVRGGPISQGPAPDFTLATFNDDTFTLSDHLGQVVVINFWAAWCKPCEEEAEDLEQTWRVYQDQDVIFIGVDYLDVHIDALAYLEKWDITYPNGDDVETRVSQAYRIAGVPETFVIDRNGNVAKLFIGPVTRGELSATIEQLLNE